MQHSFHCHLSKSFQWYRSWHNHPHHQHTHWSVLIILAISIFSFISGSIGGFNFEENYAQAQATVNLGISGDRFTVNGSPAFLLMISYFDAMSASNATLDGDFSRLRSLGFDGVRILPNWFVNLGNQLMDSSGNLRPGMLDRLKNVIDKAQRNNLIVDVTFCRDCVSGLNFADFQNGVIAVTQELIPYRNLYFDIHNEADHDGTTCGTARLCPSEARQIRDAVKAIDSQRIVSISLNSNSTNESSYVINGGMDFHPSHGPLSTLSGVRTYVAQEKAAVPGKPVHLQEPDRCRSSSCSYTATQFTTAAADAKCAGAAGWNFHTSGGYNLIGNTMFNQWLDPNVENTVANSLFNLTSGVGWGSCSGGSDPPGDGPFGIRGDCPAGYITYSGANASTADPAETGGWFCDDDGIDPNISQITYPVNGIIMCGGNSAGTAFIAANSWWPCNAGRPGNPGWEFVGGRPYKNGDPVQFYSELACSSGGTKPVTIPNGNINAGAWTQNPPTEGIICIPGTEIVPPTPIPPTPSGLPPRYLYYINPSIGRIGTIVILSGYNLTPNVQLKDSSGNITAIQGTIDSASEEVTFTVPSGLNPGNYLLKIVSNPDSDEVPFEILPGVAPPTLTGLEAPIIIGINPLTVTHGQEVEVTGEFLWSDIKLTDIYGEVSYISGFLSEDARTVTFSIQTVIPAGVYNVSVLSNNGSDTATSFDVLTVEEGQPPLEPQSIEPPAPAATKFQDLISQVFNYSLIFVGIAVFLMILWGGILWLTSAANPGNISTAKRYITNAILGAVLLVSAYVILNTINPELVGGELTLKKLKPPPAPPVQQPPDKNAVPPYYGCGSNQPIAAELLRNLGLNNFSASATCGGDNHAQKNIQDMANWLCPSVCSYLCTPACTYGGPDGDITVDPVILDALNEMRVKRGMTFKVTSFTTGSHQGSKTSDSYHYAGRAVDLFVYDTSGGVWSEAKAFLNSKGGSAICEINGEVIPACDRFPDGVHIHWQR